MWQEIVNLFTTTSWIIWVLIAVGLVLCIVEGIVPGFGVFGVIGIMCEIGAVVCQAIFTNSVPQVLLLILFNALTTIIIFLIFVFSAKHGLIGRTALVENKSSVPYNYGVDKKFTKLIGKRGTTVSVCRPVGKVKIDGRILEAISVGTMIEKNVQVKVVKIKDNTIYINKCE